MSDRLDAAIREMVAALRDEMTAARAPADPDRLLSVDEAADALGVRRTSVYQEMQAGRLRSIRIGRRRLIPSSAVTERVEAATPAKVAALEEDRRARSTTAREA